MSCPRNPPWGCSAKALLNWACWTLSSRNLQIGFKDTVSELISFNWRKANTGQWGVCLVKYMWKRKESQFCKEKTKNELKWAEIYQGKEVWSQRDGRREASVVSVGTNPQVECLFLSSWSTAVSCTRQCRCVVGAETSAEWLEESEDDHLLSRQNCVRSCPDIVRVPVPALTTPCCPSRGLGWTNPAHEQYGPRPPTGDATLPPVLHPLPGRSSISSGRSCTCMAPWLHLGLCSPVPLSRGLLPACLPTSLAALSLHSALFPVAVKNYHRKYSFCCLLPLAGKFTRVETYFVLCFSPETWPDTGWCPTRWLSRYLLSASSLIRTWNM